MKLDRKTYEGIDVSWRGEVSFNFGEDADTDIIKLANNEGGEFNKDGVRYIYGYKYTKSANSEQKRWFRNFIKAGNSSYEVEQFVESAVLRLDSFISLTSLGAIVRIKPERYPSIISIMGNFLDCYGPRDYFDISLIKETCDNVEFDADLAYKILMQTGQYSEHRAKLQVERNVDKFNQFKAERRLFEIKRYVPPAIRAAFSKFLKFKNDGEREAYSKLQGVDVLIYDDFLTSGTTVNEIIKCLKSINPNNTLTVFVLVDQHR